MSANAVGIVLGCFYGKLLVIRVGYVRTFVLSCTLFTAIVLTYALFTNAYAWLVLRVLGGFFTATAYCGGGKLAELQFQRGEPGAGFGVVSCGALRRHRHRTVAGQCGWPEPLLHLHHCRAGDFACHRPSGLQHRTGSGIAGNRIPLLL